MTGASVKRGLVGELVSDPARLRALEPSWRELAVSRGNPFLTPEWFWAWQRHYGSREEPLVGVATSGERIVGLLPMVVDSRGRSRTARFAGSGLGDHFHPVASRDAEAEVAGAIGVALRDLSRPPATILLENVDAEAPWWRGLSTATGRRSPPLVDRRSVLPRIEIGGRDWEAYLGSRSRNLRSQIGRKRRALEREHAVAVRWVGEGVDLGSEMARLFRLHEMRWAERPGASSLADRRARAFHSEFAAEARERGWLRLAFLEVDSEAVAGWYGWRLGGRFAYYQAGFDPAWERTSVGLLMFAESIRRAFEEGADEYDMLLGDEGFKQRFAEGERSVCTALVASRLRPARAVGAAEIRARRLARRMPDGVREPLKRGARRLVARLPLARRR